MAAEEHEDEDDEGALEAGEAGAQVAGAQDEETGAPEEVRTSPETQYHVCLICEWVYVYFLRCIIFNVYILTTSALLK